MRFPATPLGTDMTALKENHDTDLRRASGRQGDCGAAAVLFQDDPSVCPAADTFSVVLEDAPEHVFERQIIVDEDNQPVDVPEWKNANRKFLIREIKKDITYFNNVHKHIPRKYNVDNKAPGVCAEELQRLIEAQQAEKELQPSVHLNF